jgi:hypothetical protein
LNPNISTFKQILSVTFDMEQQRDCLARKAFRGTLLHTRGKPGSVQVLQEHLVIVNTAGCIVHLAPLGEHGALVSNCTGLGMSTTTATAAAAAAILAVGSAVGSESVLPTVLLMFAYSTCCRFGCHASTWH